MNEITVRELDGSEAETVAASFKQFSQDAPSDAHEEMWYDLALDAAYIAAGEHDARKGTMRLYVAFAGDEIVGALSLAVDSTEEGLPADTVILSRMATTGATKGAGKRLLAACCSFARERGQGVVAFALPSARNFYRSQGMTDERHRRLYRCEFSAAQAGRYAA